LNNFQTSPFPNHSDIPWVERKGFSHWAMALLWLVLVFVASQVLVAITAVSILFATGAATTAEELMTAMEARLDILFIGNSVGQIVCFGLATFLVAGLHTASESKRNFLRIRWDHKTPLYMGFAIGLVLVIQPSIMFLGYLNSLLPVPEFLAEMQQNQYRMFEDFLRTDGVLLFGLLHIAIVPAFAEEILFRGYILRAFEKSRGIIFALILSSLIFALFHLQLPNLLPLATLGAVMGLLTWLSGSIWPAVLAHFINNGAAVLLGTFMPDRAFAEMSPDVLPPIWMLALSIILTIFMINVIYRNSNYQLQS
jgi:uncharacterized protein